jgi:AraC-like DNA-binding protein
MQFHSYIPGSPLREFVDDFWLYEDYAGEHLRERILPSGTFEVVFNLREDELRIYGPSDPAACRRFAGALLSGPYAGSFMSDTAEEAAILGVHFKPGGAFAILGIPAMEFADTHVDLKTIWGPRATELRERLCALSEPAERFRLVEQALMQRLCDPHAGHAAIRPALNLLAGTHGQVRIRDVARRVDLSQRRFIEVFATEVGLTPKLFGRIQRFQHAISHSHQAPKVDWAQIAVDCGYFDQSHLIREFIEFSGAAPTDYRLRHSRLDRDGVHMKRHHLPLAS